MNFAPYQAEPELERAKSPPLRSPNASPPRRQQPPAVQRNINSVVDHDDPWATARNQRLPSPSQYYDDEGNDGYTDLEPGPYRNDYIGQTALQGGGVTGENIFQTSLGVNLGLEAALAYLLLPPAGAVVLLIFERKSDYVRFHAWQSALVFTAMLMIHVIFSWTTVISWILFVGDLLLIGYLTFGAWRHAETLDRVELPFFGRLASSFVDDE